MMNKTIEGEKDRSDFLTRGDGVRIERLDIYRGCAIILVAFGHSIQVRLADFDSNLLFKAIYMFHMPLFFYLGGMVAGLKQQDNVSGSFRIVGKRAMNLLLPFFCWYGIGFIVQGGNATFVERLRLLYFFVDNGLWFLWVLFLCSSLAELAKYLSWKTRQKSYLACIGVVVLVMLINLKVHVLGMRLLLVHLPFFFAGIYHRNLVERFQKKKIIFAVFTLIAFPCLAFFWQRNALFHIDSILSSNYGFPANGFLLPIYTFLGLVLNSLCAIVGIILFFQIVAFVFSFKNDFVQSWAAMLVFIGRRTMEIYAIHFFFIGTIFTSKNQILDFFFATVSAIALSIAISELLIKPIPLASLLLLGRRQKVVQPNHEVA